MGKLLKGLDIDPKYVIYGIIIIVFVFAVVIISIFTIISFNPELIGIKKNIGSGNEEIEPPPIFGKVDIEPTILITEKRLRQFEADSENKFALEKKTESLKENVKFFKDSLATILQREHSFRDSLIKIEGILKDSLSNISIYKDSMQAAINNMLLAEKQVELYEKRLQEQEDFYMSRLDSLEKINFEKFAKIYNNSNPQEVAKILQLLNERDAAIILKMMQAKQAGKVLEAMRPEQAAAIMMLGANP